MNQLYKNMVLWMLVVAGMVFLYNNFSSEKAKTQIDEIIFTNFMELVETEEIKEVTIKGQEIFGTYADSVKSNAKNFHTIAPEDSNLIDFLRKHKVNITAKKTIEESPWYWNLLSILPTLIFLLIIVFFLFPMLKNGGVGQAGKLWKSKARVVSDMVKERFDDVAGCKEAKTEVQEIIEFLKNPSQFNSLGGIMPKGVLLVGPPGTGKTLMAKAIAGEAGVPFLSLSGSDFVEMFVGVGAARVRDLFIQANKDAPCIVFIDEIDAVGRQRGAGLGGGNDEREQTLNALLTEMDGFENNKGVIIIAATNRPDILDQALLRPGRFDRHVVLPKPDINGREELFKVHTKKIPLAEDVNLKILAKGTAGFTGASIANIL